MAVLCLFLLLFVFMFLGVPIAISLGLSGAVSILMFSQDSVSSLAIKLFETSDAYTFLAIPFFLLSGDRKSTRLNSSHGYISYAVFCLKKKK